MSTLVGPRAHEQRTEHPHIVKSADVFDGRPRVDRTRVSVLQIVWWIESGLSPEEIVTQFPPLTLAQVYDALSYAHDHADEIDEHASRHTLRSVLKRADLVYVDGSLIPRSEFDEKGFPEGAEVYTWETLPELLT